MNKSAVLLVYLLLQALILCEMIFYPDVNPLLYYSDLKILPAFALSLIGFILLLIPKRISLSWRLLLVILSVFTIWSLIILIFGNNFNKLFSRWFYFDDSFDASTGSLVTILNPLFNYIGILIVYLTCQSLYKADSRMKPWIALLPVVMFFICLIILLTMEKPTYNG